MSRRLNSTICLVLACVMWLSPLVAEAQEAARRAQAQAQNQDQDFTRILRYVPTDASIVVLARPRLVLTHASTQQLPIEILSAVGKRDFGIDPIDVEAALLVAEMTGMGVPTVGLVLQMRDQSATLTMQTAPPFVDSADGIIIAASHPGFGERIKASPQGAVSPLAATIQEAPAVDIAATVDIAKLRPLAQAAIAQSPPLPPSLEPLKRTPEFINRVDLKFRITDGPAVALSFVANNDADAETLAGIIEGAVKGTRAMLTQQIADQVQWDDPVQVASEQYATRMMNSIFEMFQPQRTDNHVTIVAESGDANQMAVIGVLVSLTLPAIQAAREAARRAQAINQVKQLSLAMLNYEAAKGRFPARANFDADGKPLLSWRVHILPYIEQKELYEQFHLDEPWDSEHNRALIGKMPAAYANPSLNVAGRTNFLVPVGEGTVFEGNEGRRMREISDGSSKTFLVVEANADRSVIWTQPDDLEFDASNPLNGLGNLRPGGFIAARCDGSVAFYPLDVDLATLNALFTYAGGEPVAPRF